MIKNVYNNVTIFVFYTLVFSLLISCEDALLEENASQSIMRRELTSDTVDVFGKLLNEKIPQWDEEIISSVPKNVSEESFFKSTDTLNLAGHIATRELHLQRRLPSGKTLYKDSGNKEMVLSNPEIGFWKFISPQPAGSENIKSTFSEADALSATESLFEQFKLPANEKFGYIATSVGEADMGPDGIVSKAKATARHARLYREVNGIRVWGSKIMATYTLDGKAFRLGIKWPPFNLSSSISKIQSREIAVNAITKKMGEMYKSQDLISDVETQLVYMFNEDDLTFDPTILVQITPENPQNGLGVIRYSLTEGLYKPKPKNEPVDL